MAVELRERGAPVMFAIAQPEQVTALLEAQGRSVCGVVVVVSKHAGINLTAVLSSIR